VGGGEEGGTGMRELTDNLDIAEKPDINTRNATKVSLSLAAVKRRYDK
jgi:hypothetical protein